jgi:hypothetical protein
MCEKKWQGRGKWSVPLLWCVLLNLLQTAQLQTFKYVANTQTKHKLIITCSFPFEDYRLPFDVRVNDLVSRLTLIEKINQTWSIAPAIPRFGIKAYNWR